MYKLLRSPIEGDSQNSEGLAVINLENNYIIPFSKGNRHYQEYLAWLAEGNTPEPADEPETP